MFDAEITLIALNTAVERFQRHDIHDLCEDHLT